RLADEKLVPADGIYAVWARLPGESVPRAGAMSIGVRPTFGGQGRTLEVHVLGWGGGLRGRQGGGGVAGWAEPGLRFPSTGAPRGGWRRCAPTSIACARCLGRPAAASPPGRRTEEDRAVHGRSAAAAAPDRAACRRIARDAKVPGRPRTPEDHDSLTLGHAR